MEQSGRSTIDDAEIDQFSRIAEDWWNPQGKLKPLHKFNPVRLDYIKEKICTAFDRDPKDELPLKGLRVLDIGCGGGLLCEPLARLGASVVGADAAAKNIDIARYHATLSGLTIDYRVTTAEELARCKETFDIILNMEVVEHVADVALFLASCAAMVKPSGLMFIATLNRTVKAFAFAVIGAEYILGWLPKGTHDYRKFLTPEEIRANLITSGLTIIDQLGVSYNPLQARWHRSKDMSVNYIMLARRLR